MKFVPNRILAFLVVFLGFETSIFAAPDPPPPSSPPPPPGLPLDGGIFLLGLVLLLYGLFKIHEYNKQKASN